MTLRWIQASIFGAVVVSTTSNSWDPSLLPNGEGQGGAGLNPMFEFMNTCSGANLSSDSCLVSRTMDALMSMGGPPPSTEGTFPPLSARFLQNENDCFGAPDINEDEFRLLMGDSRTECTSLSGVSISDTDFESTLTGFLTMFGSESCFQQLCDGDSNVMLFEMMFDSLAECAQVELSMPQCLRNGLFEILTNGGPGGVDGQRKLQLGPSSCQGPNEDEVSFVLQQAMETCSEVGESVSETILAKATTDLVLMFSAHHCMGDGTNGCGGDEEGYDGGDDHSHHNEACMEQNESAMKTSLNIAVEFIEQCAGLTLNSDTCLFSKTMDAFMKMDGPPSSGTLPPSTASIAAPLGRSRRHRFLQSAGDACSPPEIEETLLRSIVEESKMNCSATTEEVNETVLTFMSLFGAQVCWVELCEEQSNPSRELLEIMLQEFGQCAGADLSSFSPCLLDQVFVLITSPEMPPGDTTVDGFQRHLQSVMVNYDLPTSADEDQVRFLIGMLMQAAEEKCLAMGETFREGEGGELGSELFKIFESPHCWGAPTDCSTTICNDNDVSEYLGFVKESTSWMLGQCVQPDDHSCLFKKSIDMIHSMHVLGSDQDIDDPNFSSNICTSPAIVEADIVQIVATALEYCLSEGIELESTQSISQTILNLKDLVAKTECWEAMCQPELKDEVHEVWMNVCSSTDLKFLSAQVGEQYTVDDGNVAGTIVDVNRLRCMAEYLVRLSDMFEEDSESLTCSLPRLDPQVCGLDSGRAAYIHCGGSTILEPPPTSSPVSLMSFSMDYNFDTSALEEIIEDSFESNEYSMSMRNDDFSMSMRNDDDWYPMIAYIGEVCSLIAGLQSETSKCCLAPVCENLWTKEALAFDRERADATESPTSSPSVKTTFAAQTNPPTLPTTATPTDLPTSSPSESPSNEPSDLPTSGPSQVPTVAPSDLPTTSRPSEKPSAKATALTATPTRSPTPIVPSQSPTQVSTKLPTRNPVSKRPTAQPTVLVVDAPTFQPTVMKYGEIEVSFECAVKLEGIQITEIDITQLSVVVDLLVSSLRDFLPEGAIIRIISVGGISVGRRLLLRLLQDDDTSGVDVQFEVILKETCDTAACGNSAELSATLYQDVTSELKAKVESGELTSSIQEAAVSSNVPALAKVSVSEKSLLMETATTTVTKAAPPVTAKPNSASTVGTSVAIIVGLLSAFLV